MHPPHSHWIQTDRLSTDNQRQKYGKCRDGHASSSHSELSLCMGLDWRGRERKLICLNKHPHLELSVSL